VSAALFPPSFSTRYWKTTVLLPPPPPPPLTKLTPPSFSSQLENQGQVFFLPPFLPAARAGKSSTPPSLSLIVPAQPDPFAKPASRCTLVKMFARASPFSSSFLHVKEIPIFGFLSAGSAEFFCFSGAVVAFPFFSRRLPRRGHAYFSLTYEVGGRISLPPPFLKLEGKRPPGTFLFFLDINLSPFFFLPFLFWPVSAARRNTPQLLPPMKKKGCSPPPSKTPPLDVVIEDGPPSLPISKNTVSLPFHSPCNSGYPPSQTCKEKESIEESDRRDLIFFFSFLPPPPRRAGGQQMKVTTHVFFLLPPFPITRISETPE